MQMNIEFRKSTAILLACGVLIANAAGAQTQPDPRSEAKMHVGPIYLTPALAVKEFGVDTNVFNNDRPQRDFTFTLAPHVDVWLPFARRGLLTTSVSTDLVYYQRYASERSIDPELKVRGDLFLNRITLFAEPSYLRSRQRLNYEIDARAEREERGMRAGVNVRLLPKLSVEIEAQQLTTEFGAGETFNEVSLRETLNRATNGISATVRHETTPYTTLALRANVATDRFEFSPLRDSESVRLMPGVEFNPRALISGTAYVGVRRFEPKSDSLQPFSGLVMDASLSYTLLGSTRFLFTANRDVTYSYHPLQPYFVVDGYGMTMSRQLVGRTDITAGVERHTYSYRDLLLPGALPADIERVDVTRTWLMTFGYRVGRAVRVGVGGSYRERGSNSERFRDYDGFRFISTIDYGL
jgi:hypothetical protein